MITVKCEKCKQNFMIENETGINKCPHCECENSHFVFPADFDNEKVVKAIQLAKDLKKMFKKHEIPFTENSSLELAVIWVQKFN